MASRSAANGLTTRETLLKPIGLVTTPSQYGVMPDGALMTADNVLFRNPGKLSVAPDMVTGQVLGSVNDSIYGMMPLDAGHVYAFTATSGNSWSVWENNNSVQLGTGFHPASGLMTAGRVCPVRARDRMLVNTNRGVFVGDNMAPASAPQRNLRYVGMPQAQIFNVTANSSANAAIPVNIMMGYQALLTREYSDGYIIKGPPSPPFKILNDTGTAFYVTIQIRWDLRVDVVAGDIVELYRTDGLSTTDSSADPGAVFKLVYRKTLTSTDISNQFVLVRENTSVTAPYYTTYGRECYTNPGQEGSTGANRRPDIAKAQEVFHGFTFYGGLTERAQATINVPAGIGDATFITANAYNRTYGVGQRTGAGTITAGSAVITGVSATDILGIVPGQQWYGSLSIFSAGTVVQSVGVNTITMSTVALSGPFATWSIADVIEFTGDVTSTLRVDSLAILLELICGEAVYEVTSNQTIGTNTGVSNIGNTLIVELARPFIFNSTAAANISIRATNGGNYSPPLPEINQTAQVFAPKTTKNLLRWSKDSEPEHVPSINETLVGSLEIIALCATKDALWIFCRDGIFRLTGTGGQWRIDPIESECVLAGPQCACSLNGTVYAYTNKGFVSITDAGVTRLSDPYIKELVPGVPYSSSSTAIVSPNILDSEILISLGTSTNIIYVYNIAQNGFTRLANNGIALSNVTAMEWQLYPSSGSATMLIGVSNPGTQPQWGTWNATTSFLTPQVTFQPVEHKDPALTKQWIDFTLIFDQSSAGRSVTGQVGGTTAGSGTLLAMPTAGAGFVNDARVNIGVPLNFAMHPTLRPGWTLSSSATQATFIGISMRYTPLTYQQTRQ